MTFHPDVMSRDQQQALRDLGPVLAPHGLYLAGGTALAIQLGHRRSVDLDWFSTEPIFDPAALALQINRAGVVMNTRAVERGTLHGLVRDVRVSFFEFRYPILEPLVAWREYGCDLASLSDLACMKLLAVTQRGAKKDFVDIHALGVTTLPLDEMLDLYRRKFGAADISSVLYSLTYFDDAEPQPMPTMSGQEDWIQIKTTITHWVQDIAR